MAEPEAPDASRHRWIAAAGLVAIAVVLFVLLLPAFKAPMAFDDKMSVTQIATFDSWTDTLTQDIFSLFRPVKNLFFYLMVHAQATTFAFHGVTYLAYLAATLGVFVFAKRLIGSPLWALATAAIWSLSAAHVSTAIWPSAFNISIAAASMTFGVALWDRWREAPGRIPDGIGFFLLLLLGLCSYETAVATAPLVVMIDLYRGRRLFEKGSLIRYGGVALVMVAWLVVRQSHGASTARLNNPSFTTEIETWQIAASAPYFLWTHFLMWLAPWGRLEFLGSYLWDRSIPAVIIPFCWLMLIGIGVLCARFWKPGNLFVFGLAWFFIAAFPSGNFVPLGNTPYADYYVPIPAIGLALATVAAMRSLVLLSRKPGIDRSARNFALVIVALIVVARGANLLEFRVWAKAWEQPVEMMARSAAARPHQYLAKISVAKIMVDSDRPDLAEAFALEAIEDTQNISLPYIVLGQIHYDRGELEAATAMMHTAKAKRHINPESPLEIELYMGRIIGRDPMRTEEAFQHFRTVLRSFGSQHHLKAILDTAEMYGRVGKVEKQRAQLTRGLEFHPDDPQLLAALEAIESPEDE